MTAMLRFPVQVSGTQRHKAPSGRSRLAPVLLDVQHRSRPEPPPHETDRLANGNVLIAAGRRGVVDITPESRIIEVAKESGRVVWELVLPKDHGVYRAERLYPLPLVRPIQQ